MAKPHKVLQEEWNKFKEQLGKRLGNASPNMVMAIQDMLVNYNLSSSLAASAHPSVDDVAKQYALNDKQLNHLNQLKNQWKEIQQGFIDKRTSKNFVRIAEEYNEMSALRDIARREYKHYTNQDNLNSPKVFQIVASHLSDAIKPLDASNAIVPEINTEKARLQNLDKIENTALRELAKINFNIAPNIANELSNALADILDHPTKSSIKISMKAFNSHAKKEFAQKFSKNDLMDIFAAVQDSILKKIPRKKPNSQSYYYELKHQLLSDINNIGRGFRSQEELNDYSKQVEDIRSILDNLKKLDKNFLAMALHGMPGHAATAKMHLGKLEKLLEKLESRCEKEQAKRSEFDSDIKAAEQRTDSLSRSDESTASTSTEGKTDHSDKAMDEINDKRVVLDDLYKMAILTFDRLINTLTDKEQKRIAEVNKEFFEQIYSKITSQIDNDLENGRLPLALERVDHAISQCEKANLAVGGKLNNALNAQANPVANKTTAPAPDDDSTPSPSPSKKS